MIKYIRSLKFYPFLLIVLVLFVGDNVLSKYNISLQTHKLLLIILCILSLPKILNCNKQIPQGLILFTFIVLYTIFKSVTDASPGSRMMGIIVMLPVFIYLAFRSNVSHPNRYKKVLYCSFIFECGIAVMERILYTNIFQLSIGDNIISTADFDTTDFRSIGLYGHPLQNSVVILVFINFILVYEKNILLKFGLSALGILSIFCFNTRAAMVISGCSFLLYFSYWLKNSNIPNYRKNISIILMLIVCSIFVYLFSQGVIGGRLSSMGLYDDDSAAARVDVFYIFKIYSLDNFIIGIPFNKLQLVKYYAGLYAVENFWLNWLLSYGIIFVVGLIVFYMLFFKRIFRFETKFKTLFLIIPFIILASTNPSLAVSIVPMTSFLLLSYIMPNKNYFQ